MLGFQNAGRATKVLWAPGVQGSLLATVLTFICICLGAGTAHAGGLYVNEFATTSMGTAGAGAEAWANDASTTWHNPAGMTRIEGREVTVGAGIGIIDVEFDADSDTPFGGGNGGDAGDLVPLLGTYGVFSATEDLKFGVGIFSVSGAALDYDNNWTGRFQAKEIEILTVSLNPTVAYRVTDWLSFGGGPMITYSSLDYKLAVPPGGGGRAEVDGDDVAFGYTLGALFELSPQTRLGVTYLSEQSLDFEGDLKISPIGVNVGSDTELDLAQMVRVGAYHDINEQWAVLATVGWEDWSTLDNLLVSTDGGSAPIPRDWDDTYHLSIGAHYKPVEDWLLQAGFTYDSSPVSSSDRTADMPIDRQLRFALGAQHQLTESLALGGAVEYVDFGDARINNPTTLKGDYDTNRAVFLALTLNWKF